MALAHTTDNQSANTRVWNLLLQSCFLSKTLGLWRRDNKSLDMLLLVMSGMCCLLGMAHLAQPSLINGQESMGRPGIQYLRNGVRPSCLWPSYLSRRRAIGMDPIVLSRLVTIVAVA